MNDNHDELSRVIRRTALPGKLSREVAAGACEVGGVTFDQAFYAEVRIAAGRWQERAGNCAKAAVLVPTGLFTMAAGFNLPRPGHRRPGDRLPPLLSIPLRFLRLDAAEGLRGLPG
jgi:hypothetical protein